MKCLVFSDLSKAFGVIWQVGPR